jgi:hypothetical protein
MFIFAIRHNRTAPARTPHEEAVLASSGQNKLAAMNAQIDANTASTGFRPIKIPGVTIHENPFPPWLQNILEQSNFELLDINYSYQMKYPTLAGARACERWFNEHIRIPYAYTGEMESIETSVSGDSPDCAGLEDF